MALKSATATGTRVPAYSPQEHQVPTSDEVGMRESAWGLPAVG